MVKGSTFWLASMASIFLFACSEQKEAVTAKLNPADSVEQNLGEAKQAARPNVLLIITDDQGYGDLGHHGNDKIETPTLDDLFEQGVSFDRFYVSPVCAPTRAALLTGKHYLSTGVFHVTRGGEKMHAENETLAEILKLEGYSTGLFGKWHNGLQYPHDPLGQGFDEFYGFSAGHLSEYYDNYLHHNGERVPYEGYVADVITDQAIDFMRADSDAQPFFAMLSFNTPHGPFQVPNDYFQKYKDKGLNDVNASIYGMVENIDDNIQRVLNALERSNTLNNTIVLFMSDNGPAFPNGQGRYNAGLKGHKGLVDEGGVRSPLVIHWPNKDMQSKVVMPISQHIDIVPTLLSLLNINYDESVFDGRDLSPLMTQENAQWSPRAIYSHRFRISADPEVEAIQLTPAAIRTQQMLAMAGESGEWQLYNIEEDPSQTNNLAEQSPEILADLKAKFIQWFEETTQAHGEYKTIPIEVGHQGANGIVLPAHESLIRSGLAYKHGMGWSHDWLIPINQEAGSAYWPLRVVSSGKYALEVDYSTAGQTYAGELLVQSAQATLSKSNLPAFQSETLSTERQYYTDEAPDLTWQTLEMGELVLEEGQQDLVISFDKDAQDHELWVKELRLIKQ